jgi:hypothetical protein
MLIFSAITHLNSLLNIQDYIYKGKLVALIRITAVAVQYALSAVVLSGRNSKTGFPMEASSLSVMPAPCFLNMNAARDFGFGDAIDAAQNFTAPVFGSANTTTTNTTTMYATTGAMSESFVEYIMLVVFLVFACVLLLAEWVYAHTHKSRPEAKNKPMGVFGIAISVLSIIASLVIAIRVYSRYDHLSSGMEHSAWYQATTGQTWTYSQSVTIFLVASASLHGVQALTGMFCSTSRSVALCAQGFLSSHELKQEVRESSSFQFSLIGIDGVCIILRVQLLLYKEVMYESMAWL